MKTKLYELTEENICIKTGNWIEAEYNIRNINYKYDLNLFYNGNNAFKINDVEAYINNTKIQLSQFYSYFCYHLYSISNYETMSLKFITTKPLLINIYSLYGTTKICLVDEPDIIYGLRGRDDILSLAIPSNNDVTILKVHDLDYKYNNNEEETNGEGGEDENPDRSDKII